MYFWRDKKLAEDLRFEGVSERQQMFYASIYIILYVLLTTQSLGFMAYSEVSKLNIYDYFIDFGYVFSILLSLIWAYRINSLGDNRNFIARYICLSLPIGIKTGTIIMFLIFAEMAFFLSKNIDSFETSLASCVVISLSYIFLLWRYIVCFKIAAGVK